MGVVVVVVVVRAASVVVAWTTTGYDGRCCINECASVRVCVRMIARMCRLLAATFTHSILASYAAQKCIKLRKHK